MPIFKVTAVNATEFTEENCDLSLRRLWWLMWLSLASALLVSWFAGEHEEGATARAVVGWDLACALIGLGLIAWQRRRQWPLVARQALVLALLVYTLAAMNAYFLAVVGVAGAGASYALGVVIVALFFLIRPWCFAACLLANHVGYVLLVGALPLADNVKLVAWLEGTFAVLVSILAQGLLYSARVRGWTQQRSLAQANAALEARAAEMNEVMAIAAHDLRSPLQALQLTMQEMADEPVAAERHQLERAARGVGEGMLHLISRLIEAHRIEHQRKVEAPAVTDLRALVTASVERGEPMAAFKHLVLSAKLPPAPARAPVHAAEFSQALDNLIANALKFAPGSTTVEVELTRTAEGWRVDVGDEGPGVPEKERERLFAKFFRGSTVPTGGEASSGLGLFIVRELMEGMGGGVAYAPRVPRGAVFSLTLPAAEE